MRQDTLHLKLKIQGIYNIYPNIPVESIPGILETGYTPPQAKNINVYIYPNIPVESILGILETGYTPPRAKTIKVYIS